MGGVPGLGSGDESLPNSEEHSWERKDNGGSFVRQLSLCCGSGLTGRSERGLHLLCCLGREGGWNVFSAYFCCSEKSVLFVYGSEFRARGLETCSLFPPATNTPRA